MRSEWPKGNRMRSVFVEVDTDVGITASFGPISGSIARTITSEFEDLLLEEDPLAVELLWDKMYRPAVHGRKGPTMMAISAVDCALWDIRGKWADAPVYRCWAAPPASTSPPMPACSASPWSPTWLRGGRASLRKGLPGAKVVLQALARRRPRASSVMSSWQAGARGDRPEAELMLDCWLGWDLRYARDGPAPGPLQPALDRGAGLPDKHDICAEIRRAVPFPVANGEHEYTRWGFRASSRPGAQDVLQPDILWAGGITEMQNLRPGLGLRHRGHPHGHSTHATAHFLAAQSPSLCPLQEYLVKWNTVHQFFLAHKLEAGQSGAIQLPQGPGLGDRD